MKKIREKSESCACDVLVRYVLGVSKKRVVSYKPVCIQACLA